MPKKGFEFRPDSGDKTPDFRHDMRALILAALLGAAPSAFCAGRPLLPEDLGPAQIDVSGYPAEYQDIYRTILVPFFTRYGGTARMVNSPIVTAEDWKKEIERIRTRPPCCGACPFLSLKDARALWRFMVYDSVQRKTGKNAAAWLKLREGLVERFQERQNIGGSSK